MDRTTLDYLRHGEPVGGQRYRGHGVDDPLSDKGWSQMRATVAQLDGWQQVISSPMQRCAAFAREIADQRGLPLVVVDDLREVGFGAWEGIERALLKRERRAEYDAFFRDPVNNRPAGAEPLGPFGDRVSAVFDRLVDEYAGQHLLVVAHAGVIRATFGHVAHTPVSSWYRTDVNYAALTRFAHDRRGAWLMSHNWRPAL